MIVTQHFSIEESLIVDELRREYVSVWVRGTSVVNMYTVAYDKYYGSGSRVGVGGQIDQGF